MVQGGIDVFDDDGVDAEPFEARDVARAGGYVGEQVDEREADAALVPCVLVGDAAEEELGLVLVEEFGALCGRLEWRVEAVGTLL
jgi:hypothetical protein